MATGKKLSDAYIELRADDSKLSGDVKVKATRVGKEFGSRLNRSLQQLSIDPIDIRTDPKSALAAIAVTGQHLEQLRDDADSVQMRVRIQRALTELARFRKQLGDVGDKPVPVAADVSPARRQVEGLARQLAALGVAPIDVDADPKAALAAIDRVDRQLKDISRDAATVHVRVDADSARAGLTRLRQQLGDVGEEGARGFAKRFVARAGSLLEQAPLASAVGAAILPIVPTIGAVVAGAVVGAAGVGGVVGGVALAARDPAVKTAGRELGQFVLADLTDRAGDFVPRVLDGIADIRAAWLSLGPDLDRIFASSRFIDPLIAGATRGVRRIVAGAADAVDAADPVVDRLASSIFRIGDAVGDSFTLLATDAQTGALAVDELTTATESLIRVTAGLVHGAAQSHARLEKFDQILDGMRYHAEQASLANTLLAGKLDLTADGFKKGSVEAEAYRRKSLGIATAADEAVLAHAELVKRLGEAGAAAVGEGASMEMMAARLGTVETNTELVKGAQDALKATLADVGVTSDAAKERVSALKTVYDSLYGATVRNADANQSYQASWDQLSESVKTNKGSLDIHSEAGRANRTALKNLIQSTNDLFFAEIETGSSVAAATGKHRDRIAAIKEEAHRLGLNRTQTELLIKTYGKIPPKKTTDLVLSSVDRVADALLDLAAIQLHLAKGTPISPDLKRRLARAQYGMPDTKRAFGGELPGVAPHDRADNEIFAGTPGEWVIQKPTVRKVEQVYGPGAMDHFNRHGELPLPGYATGGLLAASKVSWPRSLLYRTTAGMTRIPSIQEIVGAVTPQFGAWPSSPGAQRGDSGMWRRILAMVRGAGFTTPLVSSYRPGDPLWHGSGRADDFGGYNLDRLARFFLARQSQILEMIHRSRGRDYAYTRGRNMGSFNESLMQAHRNHLHIAMDEGGQLQPGWNPPIYNGTGRPEPVTPASTMEDVVELLAEVVAAVDRVAPGVGREINGVGAGLRRVARSYA